MLHTLLGNKNIEHESVVIDKNIWIANTQGNLSLPHTQLPKCLQSKAPNFRQLCQKNSITRILCSSISNHPHESGLDEELLKVNTINQLIVNE